jgi:adenylate cyclase class 2
MKEIELKFKIKNYNNTRLKIESVGAEYKGKYRQLDLWLDTKNRRLKREKEGLRVRQQDNKTVLTFKKIEQSDGKFREAEEIETKISNPTITLEIFKRLGFETDVKIRKEREIWRIGKVEICLDKVKDLGIFLELEGSRKDIEEVIKKLGFKNLPRIIKHYKELQEEKRSKN